MNYWDGQRWQPSAPCFEVTEGAFVANRLQHKVRLASNLNVAGAVTVTLPDGLVLRSTPLALALYDAVDGRTAILASVRDCAGVLVSTNQVLYEDAIDANGVLADVLYTLGCGSFEQDIVLKGRLNPQDYGFRTNSVQIQMYTEFYDAPRPERVHRPIRVEESHAARTQMASPDLVDEVLGFGGFVIATGRALRAGADPLSGGAAAPVANAFATAGQRAFLVESLEYASVQGELASLPDQARGGARESGRAFATAHAVYAALPSPRALASNRLAANGAPGRVSGLATYVRNGLSIDYLATIGGTVSGATTFQGDTTYFVSGPVYCNGSVTIEGGAIFKFPNSTGANPITAFIKLNGGVTCRTSSYRGAIFTAGDDDSLGESLGGGTWANYTGDTTGKYYANPCLWAYYLGSATLNYLRFCSAQEAVRVEGGGGNTSTISHSQFVNCVRGIVLTGSGSGSGSSGVSATLNNNLLANVQYPLTLNGNLSYGSAYHCTVDGSARLMTASAVSSFSFVNSIFASVAATAQGPGALSGSYNGFYPSTAPRFGSTSSQFVTDVVPFEPSSFEQDGTVYGYFVTWQGRHYLAEDAAGDVFRSVGTTNIPVALKKDLPQTTTCPPELFNDDLIADTALGPRAPRETGTPSLGYHYPVLDYVVAAATVSNARLTLKPGLALGFVFPYDDAGADFGLRVNAGARLVSEGSPTNLVVLARANLVQELAEPSWEGWETPLLAARALGEPLPEIRLRFTDMPACAGDYRAYGPQFSTYPLVQGEEIATLDLRDCQVRGGAFCYESGYQHARTLALRNSLFERATLWIADLHGGPSAVCEDLLAHNNLFYGGRFWVLPVVANTWTIIDNAFHAVDLIEPAAPDVRVSSHHHNAYIAMPSGLSSATTPNPGDQSLTALSYDAGALGRFYLPAGATQLLDHGSRSPANAGLCHYTSRTNQVKESAESVQLVNIGLHYVALVNGQPADSDANQGATDGFPDYVEDANGNGAADADESDWQQRETTPIRVLAPLAGAVVSGVVPVCLQFDDSHAAVLRVGLTDGAGVGLPVLGLERPFSGPPRIELDTRKLPNGSLTLKAAAVSVVGASGTRYATVESEPVTVTVNNDVFYPSWIERAGEVSAALVFGRAVPFTYEIKVYDSDYPVAPSPQPVASLQGASDGAGNVKLTWTPTGAAAGHPVLFPIVNSTPASGGEFLPPSTTLPALIAPIPYPTVGQWYVAYEEPRVFDPITSTEYTMNDPWDLSQVQRWFHDDAMPGWLGVAAWSRPPEAPAPVNYYPPNDPPRVGQTWPIRMEASYQLSGAGAATPHMRADWRLFKDVVISPLIRNVVIRSHMSDRFLGLLGLRDLGRIRHRYHFVFLDGCESGYGGALPKAFGFEDWIGAVSYSWYEQSATHMRPGGGVATKRPVQWYTLSDGPPYQGEIPEELSRFYIEFQANWTIRGYGLEQALLQATDAARRLPTHLDDPPWKDDNTYAFGYMNLRHNEFNTGAAW